MVKNLPAKAREADSIPGVGRVSGGGNGNPLQYSCLGNPMDRGTWRPAVQGVAKSQTQPSDGAHTHAFPCYCITELTNPEMTYLRSIAWGFLRCKATQGLISGDKT